MTALESGAVGLRLAGSLRAENAEQTPSDRLVMLAQAQALVSTRVQMMEMFGDKALAGGLDMGHYNSVEGLEDPTINKLLFAVNALMGVTHSAPDKKLQSHARQSPLPVADSGTVKDPSRGTLRSMLEQLESVDASCILVMRRIGKIGVSADSVLKEHFSKFGVVSQVLVAESKRLRSDCDLRKRPGNLGLVVMRSATSAEIVLAQGEEQIVAGVSVHVRRFERQPGLSQLSADAFSSGTSQLSADAFSSGTLGLPVQGASQCAPTSSLQSRSVKADSYPTPEKLIPQHVCLDKLASIQIVTDKSSTKGASAASDVQPSYAKMGVTSTGAYTAEEHRVLQKLLRHVRKVNDAELSCMLVCHHLRNLGMSSHNLLMQHFVQYGDIRDVYVAHTKQKHLVDQDGQGKTCAGDLGILVMRGPDSVQKIVAEGCQQEVAGHQIQLYSLVASLGEVI